MDSKINRIACDSDNIIVNYMNGSILIVTPDCTRMVDKYGNECMFNAQGNVYYEYNSPTYDELYEHCLKTKQND